MAVALLSPTSSLPSSASSSYSLHLRSKGTVGAGACVPSARRARVLVSCSCTPTSRNRGLERRHLVLSGLVSSFAIILPISESYSVTELDEDVKMAMQVDEINAYSFLYPVELPERNFHSNESRKPERYSSAAPLSPDARQRIVSERVDMIHNVVISVSIGPPNSRFLPSKDKNTWDAKDVADCILSEKSSLKVTTGQRMTESSVLDAHLTDAPEPNLFRHNVACTAERDGYLYTLNASTLSKQWDSMGPFLQKTVASFHLLPPTENYVPPYKDPWRFW